MPRGDKSKYTDKQKRMAEHIEEGYEQKGVSEETAESRAWATVNKLTGGGMKGGSGSPAKVARRRPLARKNAAKAGAKGGRKRAATARKSTSSSRTARKPTRTTRSGSKSTSRTGTAGRRASSKRTSGASKSRSTTKRGGSRGGSRKSTRSRSSSRR